MRGGRGFWVKLETSPNCVRGYEGPSEEGGGRGYRDLVNMV